MREDLELATEAWTSGAPVLAHGGALGLALEIGFALVVVALPLLLLSLFARWARRDGSEARPEDDERA